MTKEQLNAVYTAKANHRQRTFTVYMDGKKTWRTYPMDKYEFQDCLNNTSNDWRQWLSSDDWYRI